LRAMIATPFEIKPTFVYWQNGEDPKPKTVMVKASKDFPAKNLTVKSNSQAFTAKVEPAGAGEWKIEIQPKETTRPIATALTIQSDFPKEAPRSFYVNAQVNPPMNVPANPAATPAKNPAGPAQQ